MKSKVIIALTAITAFGAELFAQPGLPGDPAQSPVDGGLLLLALAGGLYGIRKLLGQNKAK